MKEAFFAMGWWDFISGSVYSESSLSSHSALIRKLQTMLSNDGNRTKSRMPEREDVSHSRRRWAAAAGLLLLAAVVVAICALPASILRLQHNSEIFKRVRAGLRGASFVGVSDVVLQSRGNDCGVAALKMILAAHGIDCDVADLASKLQLTPSGTSMFALRRVACEFGIPAKSWIINPVDLGRIPLPAIAFVNRDHFVVIRRVIASGVLEVDDPALGKLRWPVRAFTKLWSGETLVFDPAWTPR